MRDSAGLSWQARSHPIASHQLCFAYSSTTPRPKTYRNRSLSHPHSDATTPKTQAIDSSKRNLVRYDKVTCSGQGDEGSFMLIMYPVSGNLTLATVSWVLLSSSQRDVKLEAAHKRRTATDYLRHMREGSRERTVPMQDSRCARKQPSRPSARKDQLSLCVRQ